LVQDSTYDPDQWLRNYFYNFIVGTKYGFVLIFERMKRERERERERERQRDREREREREREEEEEEEEEIEIKRLRV
jgi:hypothetical protein